MPALSPPSVTRQQVLAYRLCGHHLDERLLPGSLLQASGACGLQNTAFSGALLALHARVRGLTALDFDTALAADKSLLQTWSMRAAAHAFPTDGAALFTRVLLPPDEDSLRFYIAGVVPALERIGISARQTIDLCGEALQEVLAGQALTKDELGRAMAVAVLPRLSATRAAAWQSASPYAAGQSLGESVARFTLYVHALQGIVCHAEKRGVHSYYRLTDEWLPSPIPAPTAADHAELVRRYLCCYGPSTLEHFAAWAGISPSQAAGLWDLLHEDLAPVRLDGQVLFVLAKQLRHLLTAELPDGVRLLPPYDPYLNQRDRAVLLPDPAFHRHLWRTSANPGAVLVDGELAAHWRPASTGARLKLSIQPFTHLQPTTVSRLQKEADTHASLRGARSVELEILD